MTQRIWQMLGVIFCPDRAAKAFFVLQGPSDTGKSLFTRFVEEFFTADMVSRLNLHDLKQNFAPGDLEGKRLCISSDASSEALDPVATSLIKQATGGDVISADVKYKARIQFRCEAVFVLVTNHAVRTKDPDDAFFRRAVAIPFRYAVSRSEQVPPEVLLKRLRQEMDVIASRAVETYRQLVQNRYLFAGDFSAQRSICCAEPTVIGRNQRESAGVSVRPGGAQGRSGRAAAYGGLLRCLPGACRWGWDHPGGVFCTFLFHSGRNIRREKTTKTMPGHLKSTSCSIRCPIQV